MKSHYKILQLKPDDILILEKDADGKFYTVARASNAWECLTQIFAREGVQVDVVEHPIDALFGLMQK